MVVQFFIRITQNLNRTTKKIGLMKNLNRVSTTVKINLENSIFRVKCINLYKITITKRKSYETK